MPTPSSQAHCFPVLPPHSNGLKKLKVVSRFGYGSIKARGSSSAASAANAIVDTVNSLLTPTQADDWHSVAVCSDGSYGTREGLMTSFPIRSDGKNWTIVPDLPINDYGRMKIDASVAELAEEHSLVLEILDNN